MVSSNQTRITTAFLDHTWPRQHSEVWGEEKASPLLHYMSLAQLDKRLWISSLSLQNNSNYFPGMKPWHECFQQGWIPACFCCFTVNRKCVKYAMRLTAFHNSTYRCKANVDWGGYFSIYFASRCFMQKLDFGLYFIPAEQWARFGFALNDCTRQGSQWDSICLHMCVGTDRYANQHFCKQQSFIPGL